MESVTAESLQKKCLYKMNYYVYTSIHIYANTYTKSIDTVLPLIMQG